MVFGEIVEPSSRALLNDDYVEYPETYESNIKFIGNYDESRSVNTLIFGETKFIIELMKKCFVKMEKFCSIDKFSIDFYDTGNDNILITSSNPDISTGEIIEKLSPWIKKAKNIYTITSYASALYQNAHKEENPISFIKSLATKGVTDSIFPKLEVPNIITGIGANVLSYCVYIGRKCQLFVGFVDGAPLDSISSKPFVTLFERLELGTVQNCLLDFKSPPNNLYM